MDTLNINTNKSIRLCVDEKTNKCTMEVRRDWLSSEASEEVKTIVSYFKDLQKRINEGERNEPIKTKI